MSHMSRTENGFKVEPFKFLSNMEPCKVYYKNMLFPSVENAYQSSKAIDFTTMGQFQCCNPYEAKKLGKRITMREGFNGERLSIMESLLRQKFSHLNPALRQKLINTQGIELVEVNTWGDKYWGVCNNTGENHLGKLLMKIRDDLLNGKYHYSKSEWDLGTKIYNRLGTKTVNPGSRIRIIPVYDRQGVQKAKELGGIFSLRVSDMKAHLGNPYSSDTRLVQKDNLSPVETTKDAVIAYICWILFSHSQRAITIRSWLHTDVLKGKPIIYYKELDEPSHATALEWLIDNSSADNCIQGSFVFDF